MPFIINLVGTEGRFLADFHGYLWLKFGMCSWNGLTRPPLIFQTDLKILIFLFTLRLCSKIYVFSQFYWYHLKAEVIHFPMHPKTPKTSPILIHLWSKIQHIHISKYQGFLKNSKFSLKNQEIWRFSAETLIFF